MRAGNRHHLRKTYLENKHSRTFAHYKAAAVSIEWAGSFLRCIVGISG